MPGTLPIAFAILSETAISDLRSVPRTLYCSGAERKPPPPTRGMSSTLIFKWVRSARRFRASCMMSCCDNGRSVLGSSWVSTVATLTRPSIPGADGGEGAGHAGQSLQPLFDFRQHLAGCLDRCADRRLDLYVELVFIGGRYEFLADKRRQQQASDKDHDRPGKDEQPVPQSDPPVPDSTPSPEPGRAARGC